jgi:hypothetical protein
MGHVPKILKKIPEITEAALECCFPYMEDLEDFKSPSNAIKIKYDFQRMVTAKWVMIVKTEPH